MDSVDTINLESSDDDMTPLWNEGLRPRSAPPILVVGKIRYMQLLRKTVSEERLTCGPIRCYQNDDEWRVPWLRYLEANKSSSVLKRRKAALTLLRESRRYMREATEQLQKAVDEAAANKVIEINIDDDCEYEDGIPILKSVYIGGYGDQIDKESLKDDKSITIASGKNSPIERSSDSKPEVIVKTKKSFSNFLNKHLRKNRVVSLVTIEESKVTQKTKWQQFKNNISALFSCKKASLVSE